MTLDDFLSREAATPPPPGACCRLIDRWIEVRLGFSPLARYGRDYACEAEVEAWRGEPGGMPVAVNRVLRAAGLRKTDDPRDGDVGIVLRDRLCMAIRHGARWIGRDERGFFAVPAAACWKAWRVA